MGKTKRILSFFIALIMVLALVPFNAIVYAVDVETGDEAQTQAPSVKEPTKQPVEPVENADLEIGTADELKAFAAAVNAGNSFEGKVVVLTADIDLEYTAVVIGTKTNSFKGTFDGQNYTVSNLTIYEDGSESDYFADSDDCLGLFGVINTPAVVKNVTVDNPFIAGGAYVAGIVGMAYTGAISNCHVTGEIDIEGCYMVGGITGHGYAKIENCSVIGDYDWDYNYIGATYKGADLEGDNVGGIVGHKAENTTIKGCTVANVTVEGTRKVGGIVGTTFQNNTITDCKVSNVVVGTNATEEYANANLSSMGLGGIIGVTAQTYTGGTVSNCSVNGLSFTNANNVPVSQGAITGGHRQTSGQLPVAPEGTTFSGNEAANVEGTVNSFGYTVVALPNAQVTVPDRVVIHDYREYNGSSIVEVNGAPIDPQVLLNFKALDSAEEAANGAYGEHYTDFFITLSGLESSNTDGCYLVGNYGTWGWVAIPLAGMNLSDGVYPVMSSILPLTYEDICRDVKDFTCGIYFTPEFLEANPEFEISLDLGLCENLDDAINGNLENVEMVTEEKEFSYTAEVIAEATRSTDLPNAEVNDITGDIVDINDYQIFDGSLSEGKGTLNPQIVLEFIAKDNENEAANSYYADFVTDFFITLNGIENADTTGCYLIGNYGEFGWIAIPLDDMELTDGTYSVISSVGFEFTYEDICTVVKDFKCGIYFTPEFLEANPDFEITLDLGLCKDMDTAKEADLSNITLVTTEDQFSYTVEEIKTNRENNSTVAEVNGVGYASLEEAFAAAQAGDEVIILADVAEDVTVPAGVIFNGNGKQVGVITAAGEITFKGHTKTTNFGVQYVNTTINIIEGACLELTGTGRMVIGHGCTFNITGTITNAKTAENITPSLIMPGASFTGAGVTFNVTNAYIKTTASYCSSSKTASGTFDFNIENSIWEQFGKLAFEAQSTAATVNFELKDSVLTTTSHLVFGVANGEVVIDNSNVNVGASRQIENRSTMTIKNGSVVNGAVATSSNAINPGTIIVENATYAVTGQFSGAAAGTGTLIIKKGATVSVGSIIDKANIVIDAAGMTADDAVNFTGNLSKFTGTIEVINNDKLEAKIVDGKIVLSAKAIAQIGDNKYETLEEAFKAATEGCTIEILADVVIDYKWDCRDYATGGSHSQFKESVTINGNGHTIKFTGAVNDNNWNTIFRFEENATVNNITIDISEATGAQRVISAKKSLTVDGLTIVGAAKYGVIFGEGTSAEDLANTEIVIKNSDLNGTRRAISDNEGGKDVKSVTITDNTLNANTYVSAYGSIVFTGNTVTDAYVDLRSYTADNKLNVTATGNTLKANTETTYNYIQAGGTVDAQEGFMLPKVYVAEVNGVGYASLEEAFAAAQAGDTIVVLEDIELDTTIVVAAGKELTIDLNGKTITGTDNSTGSFALFTNKGDLTITGEGKITLVATNNRGWNAYSSVISNTVGGKLTVENGTIEHLGGTDMAYGIDNLTNGKGTYAETIINGGTIKSTYRAIRQFLNGVEAQNILTVNGGTIEGANKAIWMQDPSKNANTGKLTVGENAVINGNIYLTVTAGSTEWPVEVSIAAAAVNGEVLTSNVPAKYTLELNNGVYGIGERTAVAQVGETVYYTLQEAIDAAQNGETVILLADIADSATIKIAGKSITLDLNGKAINGICNAGQSSLVYIENNASLTVKDSVGTGKIAYAQGTSNVGWTIDVKGEFVLESGTIELTGSWSIGYAVEIRPNSWGTEYTNPSVFVMNGGTILSSDGAVRVASSSADTHKMVSASFVMNDGRISAAWDGIFIQQSNAIYDDLSFTMNGGVIESGLNPVRVYGPAPTGYVNDQDCMSITLAGGTMTYTGADAQTWVIEGILRVGGGSSIETILENGTIAVSGAIAQETAAPEGYQWVDNGDGGTYGIEEKPALIQVMLGNTVLVEESLTIRYYVDSTKLDANKSYYAVITFNGVETEAVKLTSDMFGKGSYAKCYLVNVSGITAKQMGEIANVVVYEGEDTTDRSNRVSVDYPASIKSYATGMFAYTKNEQLKKLLIDMLYYGAAAQVQFNYNTDALVTEGLTDAQKAYASTAITDGWNGSAYTASGEVSQYFQGSTASLKDKVELNFRFINLAGIRDKVTFKISYVNYRGETISYEQSGADATLAGSVLVVAVPLVAADMRTVVTCELYIDGNAAPTVTATQSVEAYCYLMSGGNIDSIYGSIIKYSDSAKKYLNK